VVFNNKKDLGQMIIIHDLLFGLYSIGNVKKLMITFIAEKRLF